MSSGPSSNVSATRRVVEGPLRMTPGNASNTAFLTNARTVAGTLVFIRAIARADKRVRPPARRASRSPAVRDRADQVGVCAALVTHGRRGSAIGWSLRLEVGAALVAQRVLLELS